MSEVPPAVKAVTDALTPYLIDKAKKRRADINLAVLDMLASTEKVMTLMKPVMDPELFNAMTKAIADAREVLIHG